MRTGANYDLPLGLASLAGGKDSAGGTFSWSSIQEYVGIVSGLQIPTGGGALDVLNPGGPVPLPAGLHHGAAHGMGMAPQISGSGEAFYMQCRTPSADQLAAGVLGTLTPRRNIPLQVEPINYDNGGSTGQLSWKAAGAPDTAEAQPTKAFQAILGQQ